MAKKQRPTFDPRRTTIVAPGRQVVADRVYTEGQVFPWRRLSMSVRRARLIYNQKKLIHPSLEEDPAITLNEPEEDPIVEEPVIETPAEEVQNEQPSEEVEKTEVVKEETVEQVEPEPKPKETKSESKPQPDKKAKSRKPKAKVEEPAAEPDQVVDGSKPWESLPKE